MFSAVSFTPDGGTTVTANSTINAVGNGLTLGGNLTGSDFAVNKTGAGGLTLTGETISVGTITLSEGGVVFSTDATQAVSSNLSGSGTLTKLGTGTTTLTGALAHSGGTTISAGTLQLTSADAVAVGTGGVTLNGGTLALGTGVYDLGDLTANSGSIDLLLNSATDFSKLTVGEITSDDYGFLDILDNFGEALDYKYDIMTSLPTGVADDFDWNLLLAPDLRGSWSLVSNGSGLTLQGAASAAVPEPSTWLLLALGAGLVLWRRKK
ncbi:MAG: autotransporter-associated beta strand repeat-containing protein [Planctomycetia bacterium]|nr:autotransporter-associated beta strand repeat-containing protein [Planctomycetia bacterium]